jgi:hypothetical protein
MAALALMGAIMTGCSGSGDDGIADSPQPVITPQQPANNSKTLTLTTTVGLDDGSAGTRALTIDYDLKKLEKTFAVGETMALIYHNGTSTVKAESHALAVGDITNEGKSANFTFDLETPNKSVGVTYIYPAAMANDDGSINYAALNTQDGTLDNIASGLDLATCSAAWAGASLPANATLTNQLAILAINLKDYAGSNSITSGLNQVTVGDGTNTYTVAPSGSTFGSDVIYVAINPTENKDITVTATDGTNDYAKILTGKTYERNNLYNLGWKMGRLIDLSKESIYDEWGFTTAQNGDVLTGGMSEDGEFSVKIAAGAEVTLKDVSINFDNNISCGDNVTIILVGENSVTNLYTTAISVGSKLTIDGTGSLTARGGGFDGVGIGSFEGKCGDIVINGGTIMAYGADGGAGIGSGQNASCGDITITGGTVMAIGGGAGIGSGDQGSCGDIAITGGTVEVYGGNSNPDINFNNRDDGGNVVGYSGGNAAGIGSGHTGSCGNITINGVNVTAHGTSGGAGIGSGDKGSCGDITITGCTVYTECFHDFGAGIGSGHTGSCDNIVINGSTITAFGGNNAAIIGSGYEKASCGDITISNCILYLTNGNGKIGAGDDYSTCGEVTLQNVTYPWSSR